MQQAVQRICTGEAGLQALAMSPALPHTSTLPQPSILACQVLCWHSDKSQRKLLQQRRSAVRSGRRRLALPPLPAGSFSLSPLAQPGADVNFVADPAGKGAFQEAVGSKPLGHDFDCHPAMH